MNFAFFPAALQISGLTATALGANRANVKWENSTGPVTGYEITVCTVSEQPECRTERVQKTSYDLKYLDSGTTYEVEVRAFLEEEANRTNGKSERTSFTTTYSKQHTVHFVTSHIPMLKRSLVACYTVVA